MVVLTSSLQTAAYKHARTSAMVDLFVGPEKKLFRVHKSFLCNKIPYFDKMFNGGFKEAIESQAFSLRILPSRSKS